MAKKYYAAFILPGIFLTTIFLHSCIKDKYDFDKLSTQVHLQTGLIVPVVHGSLLLGNVVEPNDTIVFNDDGSIKVVFRKDSIFTIGVDEVFDLSDQAIETQRFPLGAYELNDFSYQGVVSLDEMAQHFDPVLYSNLQALDGTTAVFPPIPDSNGGSYDITPFPNFTEVTFSSGTIRLKVTNNLPVGISALTLRIKRTSDGTTVGNDLIFGTIQPGDSGIQTMDLAGLTVPNELTYEVVSIASPGSAPNSVPINLSDGLAIDLSSSHVMVASGNAIIPDQIFFADTDNYNLDLDTIQITYLSVNTGEIEYTVSTPFTEDMVLQLTLPTGQKDGDTLRYTIPVSGNNNTQSILRLDSAEIDLSAVPSQPYNMLPFEYKVELISSGNYVDFDLADSITFSYQIKNISFNYVRGYFGQHDFQVPQDSVEVGLDEVFENVDGTISLTNPIVNVTYTNGFGVPSRAEIDVVGKTNDGQTLSLNAPVMDINYPANVDDLPEEGSLVFDKNNTSIVQMIDLHPAVVDYGGSVHLNPDGFQGFTNFVKGESSFVGNLEVEVPLELRIQDLALKDTVDNPFYIGPDDNPDFSLEDLDYARIYLNVDNGFPIGVDFTIYIYDTVNQVILDSIAMDQPIDPAPVDNNGRVTSSVSGTRMIELGRAELDKLEMAEQLIVSAVFNSTNQGTEDVKIYTDYTIDFMLSAETSINLENQ